MADIITDIKQLIADEKPDEEIQTYLEEHHKLTPDKVESFLNSEEGKRLLQPKMDSYFSKGLDTWKENNLGKIVEDEVAKRNPKETEEQKALRELKSELEEERKARIRESLKSQAITQATAKGLPVELVDHFLGQDQDQTELNLTKLEKAFNKAVEQAVQTKFQEMGGEPTQPKQDPVDLDSMSMAEYMSYREKQGIQ